MLPVKLTGDGQVPSVCDDPDSELPYPRIELCSGTRDGEDVAGWVRPSVERAISGYGNRLDHLCGADGPAWTLARQKDSPTSNSAWFRFVREPATSASAAQ